MSVIAVGGPVLVEPGSNEDKVIQATLRCLARWGVSKTTLDDIAAEAGVSRATIYRAFPGGKDVLLTAVLQHEVRRFFLEVTERFEACERLDELCVTGVHETYRHLTGHGALAFLLDHEADLVMAHLAVNRLDSVLAVAVTFVTPHLAWFIGSDAATEHAEWVVRNVLSYTLSPSDRIDLTDRADVEHLVATYFMPVLTSTRTT